MSWTRFSLKQLREGRVASLTLVLFTLVTCAIFAAAPRLLTAESDVTLRSTLAASPADVRGLQIVQQGRVFVEDDRLSGRGDPLAPVEIVGADIESRFPAAVEAWVSQRSFVVDTPRFVMPRSIVDGATIRLRVDPSAATRLRVVAGRLPSATVADPGGGLPSIEVALSQQSARVLRVSLGSRFTVGLDSTDPLGRNLGQAPPRIEIRVAGLFDVVDSGSTAWFNDSSLAGPKSRSIGPLTVIDDATAYASPAAYTWLDGTGNFAPILRHTWRFAISPDLASSSAAPAVMDGLKRMESLFPQSAAASRRPVLQTGLLPLLSNEAKAWSPVAAVLSIFMVGAGSVAALALVLVAVVGGRGRRRFGAVLRNRGASRRHVILATTTEGGVLVGPAALAGAALAVVAVPAGSAVPSATLAAAIALVTIVVYGASARLGSAEGSAAGIAGIRRVIAPDVSRRRAVLEILAVAVAGLAVFELRSRGVDSLAGRGGPEPWIAAAPALVGFAASLAAVRLFPLALRALAAAGARGRGLVTVLALRLASRSGAGGPVLAALIAIATIGAFASAALVHLDRAAEAAAWQDAGAAFRVTGLNGGSLLRSVVTADLPGVAASATVSRLQSVQATATGGNAIFIAVDPQAYDAVVTDTPADGVVPVDALVPTEGPAPAIVSSTLIGGPAGIAVGQTLDLILPTGHNDWRIVATAQSFPGVPPDTPFVVVSRDAATAALGEAPTATDLLLRAPAADADRLRAAVAKLDAQATFVDAATEARGLEGSPYRDAVVFGAAAALAIAAAYAALAIAAAFALAGAGRALELAHLRTLGLTRREALVLAVVEHVPTVALGFLGGAAIGLWLFVFLEPGLGLTALVGRHVAVPAGIEPWQLGALLVWLVVLVAAGIGIQVSLERRTVLVTALRRGTE